MYGTTTLDVVLAVVLYSTAPAIIAAVITKSRSRPGARNHVGCFLFYWGWLLATVVFVGVVVLGIVPRALHSEASERAIWVAISALIVTGGMLGTCESVLTIVPTVVFTAMFACIGTANVTRSFHWFDPTTVMAGLGVGAFVVVVQWLRLRNE